MFLQSTIHQLSWLAIPLDCVFCSVWTLLELSNDFDWMILMIISCVQCVLWTENLTFLLLILMNKSLRLWWTHTIWCWFEIICIFSCRCAKCIICLGETRIMQNRCQNTPGNKDCLNLTPTIFIMELNINTYVLVIYYNEYVGISCGDG